MKLKGQWDTRRVWLDGKELRPYASQRLRNHSPDGFMWGYGGSGPAQLALAVMLEHSESADIARSILAAIDKDLENL